MLVRHEPRRPRAPRWLGLVCPLVILACGTDEDVGGGTQAPTTQPPDPTTTTTMTPTPTTSETATDASSTSSGEPELTTSTGPSDTTTTGTPPDPLEVDCGTPPGGAKAA